MTLEIRDFNVDLYFNEPRKFILETIGFKEGEKKINFAQQALNVGVYDISYADVMLIKRSITKLKYDSWDHFILSDTLSHSELLKYITKTTFKNRIAKIDGNCFTTEDCSRTLEWTLERNEYYVLYIKELEQYMVISWKRIID